MLAYLTLIFSCQLAGELLVVVTGWPVPGPVVGMALLFLGLVMRGRVPDGLGGVSDGLLGSLSLLFVPAGVGVMQHAGLIGSELLPISAALVVSTVVAIGVTGSVMAWLGPKAGPSQGAGQEGR